MTANDISREQAIAMADGIEERLKTEHARLRAARTPDSRVGDYRNASSLRRSARRIRAGIFLLSWNTESPEEIAREYDYTAEYDDMMVDVQRLKGTHKRVQQLIASGMYSQVKEAFDHLMEKLDRRSKK